MARKYGDGEQKSGNVCCINGCNRRRSRSGMGTCGRSKCIAAANRLLVEDSASDNRDPARNAQVKINGSWHRTKASKTVRGTPCVVLQDGTTVRISDVQAWQ